MFARQLVNWQCRWGWIIPPSPFLQSLTETMEHTLAPNRTKGKHCRIAELSWWIFNAFCPVFSLLSVLHCRQKNNTEASFAAASTTIKQTDSQSNGSNRWRGREGKGNNNNKKKKKWTKWANWDSVPERRAEEGAAVEFFVVKIEDEEEQENKNKKGAPGELNWGAPVLTVTAKVAKCTKRTRAYTSMPFAVAFAKKKRKLIRWCKCFSRSDWSSHTAGKKREKYK